MIVYFIQVKMSKGCHTLTMNLIANIMMYETKKYIFIDKKKKRGVMHFFKKKQNNKKYIKIVKTP